MTVLKSLAAVSVVLGMAFAVAPAAHAQLVDQSLSGKAQLKALMRPHHFDGSPVSREARAATGNPNITVIDRRTSGISRCSFLNRGNERVLQCDS